MLTGNYIYYGGSSSLPPAPAYCNKSIFYSFAMPADLHRCQLFIDRTFNQVAGYPRFKVMIDQVFLAIITSEEVGSLTPPFRDWGSSTETDMGFWLLVGDYKRGALLPDSLAWAPAFLMVDNPFSTAGGREVWGYPKTMARMVLPTEAPSEGPFEASAVVIKTYAPTAHADWAPVLTLRGAEVDHAPSAGSPIHNLLELISGAAGTLVTALVDLAGEQVFLGGDLHVPIPVVFL